ncbi:hypothetical protein GCM10009789_02050 [Kribbella sancticallisti]|uniref:Secreted protein n=1 Tax=Kribbella sancticallisti TaxID=460087 RepID=A0ABN2C3F7_9ACTN
MTTASGVLAHTKTGVRRAAGIALAATALAGAAAVVTAPQAQAYPAGCTSGFLWRSNGTIGGGYARCNSSSGTAYQVAIRCQNYSTGYASYHTGPWLNPGMGDSTAWCPSNAGATDVWINLPD